MHSYDQHSAEPGSLVRTATSEATVVRPARAAVRPTHQLQRRFGNQALRRAALARQAAGGSGAFEAPAGVEEGISQARGAGQALDGSLRTQMEGAFGADFSNVRIHTGSNADTLNRSISARAFTTGNDIFFRSGEYNPTSSTGQELLAHELTHVMQQSGGVHPKLSVGAADDEFEREADQMSAQVMRRLAQPTAQRQEDDEEPEALGGLRLQRQIDHVQRQMDDDHEADALGGLAANHQVYIQRKCAACAEEEQKGGLGGLASEAEDQPVGGLVLRQSAVPVVQRDLAREPPNPGAVAPVLTEAQLRAASRFNQRRFQDPFTIAIIRDVIGISRFPAVPDDEFAQAIAQWQAENNLTPDGKAGADTTRTLIGELTAESLPDDVRQLRLDNMVTTSDITAPVFNNSTALPRFRWDVTFQTTLRNGFIIQQIDNVWNVFNCDGTPHVSNGTPCDTFPTPRYWEAWRVDGAGNVTPVGNLNHNDRWQRCFIPGTRGNWSMTGTTFTTLTLPNTFAAGNIPDAGILQSTAARPNSDFLGLPAGRRTIGGEWDACAPNNFHRRR